jgi:site-specific recombinase XerD
MEGADMATDNPTPNPEERKAVLNRFANYLYNHCALAPSTVDLHVGYIRRTFGEVGTSPTHEGLEQCIADMRRGGASYGAVTNAMRAFEWYSEFLGNPLQFRRPKRPEKANVATLSEARIAVMIASTKNIRDKTMLAVMATTGIRNNELVHLRIKDINIGQQLLCVEIGKGAKGRLIPLTPAAMELLGEYLRWRNAAPEDWLFITSRNGNQLQTQDVRKFVRVLGKRLGISGRVWPHLLRHSLATAMLDRGASVYSIQALLGHSWITTTLDYYLHPSRKSVQADCLRCAPSLL